MRSNCPIWMLAWLALGAAVLLLLGVALGSSGLETLAAALQGDDAGWQIVRDIRLPRTLGAWLAGALLGLGGALAQGLFRNPLADPFLLGSASGASLGVALALALAGVGSGSSGWALRLGLGGAAFGGALVAVLLTLALARGVQQTLRLLLAGIVVGVVLGALKDLISMAAPDVLQPLQAFMLGSTALLGWEACALMLGVLTLGLALGCVLAPVLDALALGEATASSLGLPLSALRLALLAVLALATGAAVAQTGLIVFVGLASAHLVRGWVRTTHGWLLPLAACAGGLLLMAADLLARSVLAPQELPVGVLTAALGGVYLLWLLHRGRSALGEGA